MRPIPTWVAIAASALLKPFATEAPAQTSPAPVIRNAVIDATAETITIGALRDA